MPIATGFIITLLSGIMCRNAQENCFWPEENREKKKSQLALEAGMSGRQRKAHPAAELFSFHVICLCLKYPQARFRAEAIMNPRQTCLCAHQMGTKLRTGDQQCLTVHRRSHPLGQLHVSSFKILLILLATGAKISLYEKFPSTPVFTKFWIIHLILASHPLSGDGGQVVTMVLAAGCGLEDALLHTAGVSEPHCLPGREDKSGGS